MKTAFRVNRWFIIPTLGFLGVAGTVLLAIPKGEIHLFVNRWHCGAADTFFACYTWLGDGWAIVGLVLVLFFVRFRDAITVAGTNLLCSLVTQTLKHGPFADAVRPVEYFKGTAQLHLVPGVEVYSYNSFPSGHAAVAFATGFCLAAMVKRPAAKFGFFILSVTVAFSRVYLSEHFLGDIYAGALIGLGMSLAASAAAEKAGDRWRWMQSSLLRLRKGGGNRKELESDRTLHS